MTRRDSGQLELLDGGRGGTKRVRRGVDAQLAAQRQALQLEPVDAGLIAVARSMADALDAEIGKTDRSTFVIVTGLAKLVPVLIELRGERRADADGLGWDEELAALALAIRNAARPDPPDDR